MFGMTYTIGSKLEVSENQAILQIVKEDKEGNVPMIWHKIGLNFLSKSYGAKFSPTELANKVKAMKKCKHNSNPITLDVKYLFENGQKFNVCPDCNKVLKVDSYESENTQKLIDLKFAEIHLKEIENQFQEIENDYLFKKEQAQLEFQQAKKVVDDIRKTCN